MPMLEPSDSQESKNMMVQAFQICEDYNAPVMLRMATSICHSKNIVECEDREEVEMKEYEKDLSRYFRMLF